MRPELGRFIPSFLKKGQKIVPEGGMHIMRPDRIDYPQILTFLGSKWEQRQGHVGTRFIRDMRSEGLPSVGIEFTPSSFLFFVNKGDLFRMHLTKMKEVRLLPENERFPARIVVTGQDAFFMMHRDSLTVEFHDVYSGMSGFFTFEQLASMDDKNFHRAVVS